jgi:putative membrane protein
VDDLVHVLPHINASLNGLAAGLLVAGWILIKQRRETAHKWTMLACFGVSVVFLACYLTYHAFAGSRPFPREAHPTAALVYYPILLTHVILAAAVPFLAVATIYSGLKDNRPRHIRLARITFPIWLYVSITGVIVYWMLYRLFPIPMIEPKM